MRQFILLSVFIGMSISLHAQPDHSKWTFLLKKHVQSDGMVDYQGFKSDKSTLNAYLDDLSKNGPTGDWSKEQELAYWINVYNAFTVKAIIDHMPLKSILDIKPNGYESIWKKPFIELNVQGKNVFFSLDQIENEIIRKRFKEPRIHFALNCASFSCPPLRNEAFVAAKLNQQLEEQTRRFIEDSRRNTIGSDQVVISKIFDWFRVDFESRGTLIDFLNRYSSVRIKQNAQIQYMNYDWSLNSK